MGRSPSSQRDIARKEALSDAEKNSGGEFVPFLEDIPDQIEEEISEEQVDALSLTLMQQMGKLVEEALTLETATVGVVNLEEFGMLLARIEMDCSAAETKVLFDVLDADKSGQVRLDNLPKQMRESRTITDMYDNSLRNVALTLVPTFAVALGFLFFKGGDSALDFVTCYVVEDSLSVDNLFVFLFLFKYFKVPPSLQPYCLNIGIVGAVVLRAMFIFGGLAAIKVFRPLLLIFSLFLIWSSYQGLTAGDGEEEEEDEEMAGPVKQVIDMLPMTDKFDGDKLVIENGSGGWLATPLALCIIAVELSDILFAVDSVPAVFAVTEDPVIVFTSNMAAILGLRSLYQLLAIAAQDLAYLEKAVAIVLGFVGLKLGAEVAGLEVASNLSLGVIVTVLGGGVGLSLQKREQDERDVVDALMSKKSAVRRTTSDVAELQTSSR